MGYMKPDESPKVSLEQFLSPTDHGFLNEHVRLTDVLHALVGDDSFKTLATHRKAANYDEAAHQAAEDAARYYILDADNFPTQNEARAEVIKRFENFLDRPESIASAHNMHRH